MKTQISLQGAQISYGIWFSTFSCQSFNHDRNYVKHFHQGNQQIISAPYWYIYMRKEVVEDFHLTDISVSLRVTLDEGRGKKKAMNDQDSEGTCQQVTLSETVSFSFLFYVCKKYLEASAFLSRLFIVTVSFCSVLNSELTFTSWPIVYAHWVQNVALMDNWMKRRFQTKTNTFPTRKSRVIFSSPYSG